MDMQTETKRIVRDLSDLLLDNIATAMQDRSFLRGDPLEDKDRTEVVVINAEQVIGMAIQQALKAARETGFLVRP